MSRRQLLVVDDEDNLRAMLAAALRHHDFDVVTAADGREALAAVAEHRPDLIVLDVMMPHLDGVEVCNRLRLDGNSTPIVFLTARDDPADAVRALKKGGDDYVTKPFSLDELVARVDAVLRRAGVSASPDRLELGDIVMDLPAYLVTKSGVSVQLSPTEYNLLRVLLGHQGQVLSKAQLLDLVWGDDIGRDAGIVETYIGYLRKKVDTGDERLIHTVRGVGYTARRGSPA